MTRRDFLGASAGGAILAAAATVSAQTAPDSPWKKAVTWGMLPGDLPPADRMALAKRCGYDGIEMPPVGTVGEATELRQLAEAAGLALHSVIYGGWGAPLSSADPAVTDKGKEEILHALACAQAFGADNVLVVPAIVNAETRYADAYDRSQKHLRELIPAAEQLGVTISVENVWNKFLLSPLEFARYVDELNSPYLRAYFDVGNVVVYGWSEDWILTLGERIKRIHLKDFRRSDQAWMNLREGDVDWPKVTAALREVGYAGFCTCELGGGDEAYLTDVAGRVDKIFAGE